MTPERFESLSPRQRECLRLVAELKAAGEIATELNISVSTVNGYIAEAVRHLGARNRREAAKSLSEYEASAPEKHGGEETRVVEPTPSGAPMAPPETASAIVPPAQGWSLKLPIRRQEQVDNHLSVAERLFWVPAVALAIAIAFGMLMTGLQIAAALIERVAGPLPR
jgi:DNA-binding CsgD family transcriptional regulator